MANAAWRNRAGHVSLDFTKSHSNSDTLPKLKIVLLWRNSANFQVWSVIQLGYLQNILIRYLDSWILPQAAESETPRMNTRNLHFLQAFQRFLSMLKPKNHCPREVWGPAWWPQVWDTRRRLCKRKTRLRF